MTLALIAGQGGVPPHLVKSLLARGEVPLICEMAQFPSEVTGDLPRLGFRLESFGNFLAELRARGITRLCMAGAMRRPAVDPSLIDAATAPYIPRLQGALAKGDDGLLREIIAIFETSGIEVIGAAGIAPDLLPEPGLRIGGLPDGIAADLAAAVAALDQMGRDDLGQAVVVRAGRVVAREDERGTDAMLADLTKDGDSGGGWSLDPFDIADQMIGGAADWLSGQDSPTETGGLLYKAPKPGQDLRADMPVIGPDTARRVVAAGLDGIVIEAGGVMLLEPEDVRGVLAVAGLFLWVRPGGTG
ncbi:UDP-2,3-diacylglucosamine diphosphatase LpxI [uncultured Roseovarius sp.]|uniref:UDP-2,3-diacylglucosamine diphosphatase LpxI domain-containing protein n=1 Tax=uncultured Roseovarius sp. TaxID=293344 RepID=UPI0026102F03|nr:UDP-2,3-diacylglucosamine diphosphatase LpxI [uncultured Roseovarius sp.]